MRLRPPRTPPPGTPVQRATVAPSGPPQRIAKLLARAGIASRREIERMIEDGRIALNGAVLTTPATILASLDGVTVDGNPVEAPAPARLFLYHKPAGLLVTERDPAGRPTIYDRLPTDLPRLVPVGRLDLNTEGLLLLTTDGELKRQLELPATGVERAYRARAYGTVSQAQLEALIEGVEIEGVRYGSINANLERRTGANVWIEMILTEGKNREVRRVLEYLGLKVSRLIRTRYGPFLLGDLGPNEIGEVRGHDVAAFRRDPTRNPPPERIEQRQQPRRGAGRTAPARAAAPPPSSVPAETKRAARARVHRGTLTPSETPAAPPKTKRPAKRLRPSRPGDAEAPRPQRNPPPGRTTGRTTRSPTGNARDDGGPRPPRSGPGTGPRPGAKPGARPGSGPMRGKR